MKQSVKTIRVGGAKRIRKPGDRENKNMPFERHLSAAQGYLELDMYEDALEELDALPGEYADHEEILTLRLVVYMQLKNWAAGEMICRRLQERLPNLTVGYIHGAFCLHEMGKTKEARDMLLGGPSNLLREAIYHYNMGCYEASLGNFEEAIEYLKTSFAMDTNFRITAHHDADLEAIRHLF